MELPMVRAAQWHREFVADLATECTALRKAQMVSIRRASPANQTGLLHHMSDMVAVTNAALFGERQCGFVDRRQFFT